jgi:hypothetical protein
MNAPVMTLTLYRPVPFTGQKAEDAPLILIVVDTEVLGRTRMYLRDAAFGAGHPDVLFRSLEITT